jgi:hypothetical protein
VGPDASAPPASSPVEVVAHARRELVSLPQARGELVSLPQARGELVSLPQARRKRVDPRPPRIVESLANLRRRLQLDR